MENNLLFLKHLIKNAHPDWDDAMVEMEAIKVANGENEDAEEGCLYCGS